MLISRLRRGRWLLDHHWAHWHMSEYLDGELGPRGRTRMERHIEVCDECRGLCKVLRTMLEALRRLPVPWEGVNAGEMAAAVQRRIREAAET
jgi:anti-sigma factor RsiW